jgi:hypothetical protein
MAELLHQDQGLQSPVEELRRISLISFMAFLLFGLSVVLDGPVTVLAWILSAAGLLCLVYLVVASRTILRMYQSPSRKVENQQ